MKGLSIQVLDDGSVVVYVTHGVSISSSSFDDWTCFQDFIGSFSFDEV